MNKKQITRVTASLLLVAGTAFLSGCNKDDDGTTTGTTTTTATDQNGNSFKTVTIGSQTWMAENLKVTTYNDGTAIPNVTDDDTWAALTTGAQCTYNNTTDADTINTYGRLYNWYAVDSASNGGKNICPTGWHVPTDAEWTTLEEYMIANGYNYDSTTTDNKIAKALASTTGWDESDEEGTPGYNPSTNNKSGFNALPGGFRGGYSGSFYDSGSSGYWWSSTENDSTNAYDRGSDYDYSNLYRDYFNKPNGFSIRCLKN